MALHLSTTVARSSINGDYKNELTTLFSMLLMVRANSHFLYVTTDGANTVFVSYVIPML